MVIICDMCKMPGLRLKVCALCLLCLFLSREMRGQCKMRLMTWNLENMYDCQDDTLREDEEFLPESERQWTWGRYWAKVEEVSRVVMGVGEDAPPALVALQEVENDSVMRDLTMRGSLRALSYRYVMTDGPDRRGVDVALMYQPLLFQLLGSESWRVPSLDYGLRPTRDLLHAWGQTPCGDTLHVVVCHLPSRLGGRMGKRNRKLAAETLRSRTDSLLSVCSDCKLVVMGDFNAPPSDAVFKKILRQVPLVDLVPQKRRPVEGTYRFQGNWSWIDHILVSPRLFALQRTSPALHLYAAPWMRRMMTDGTWYPRRTYMGTHYAGGVSDHLPLYFDLVW